MTCHPGHPMPETFYCETLCLLAKRVGAIPVSRPAQTGKTSAVTLPRCRTIIRCGQHKRPPAIQNMEIIRIFRTPQAAQGPDVLRLQQCTFVELLSWLGGSLFRVGANYLL